MLDGVEVDGVEVDGVEVEGVASDFPVDSVDPVLPEAELPAASDVPLDSPGLALAYRSLYQPPPLRWNAAAVSCLASAPPQELQISTGGSLNFWRCSS